MKLEKLEFGWTYRGCEIYPNYGGFQWFGPGYDVDAVGDPLEYVATGGHGHANTIEDCQSDIDDWVVDAKMGEIKDSLKDFAIDEGMEILGWVMENLR